ncbi:MAG: alpha-mannosidase [Actinobacteria bacterium 13_2_20CM_2_71_6]|nr:MAG: alpha-mannosidase [Actinobacteria bacterium 13_2_20CM_2_71_6]
MFGAVVAMLVAVPLPGFAGPPTAPQPADPAPLFASSFEPAGQQPAWSNTVETDAAGNRKTAGIDGTSSRGIPGNLADKVVEIAASGEYTASGEVKENLNDGDVNSKWLVFTATAWVQFKLSEPVAVVAYALSSANDAAERDPRDWTLQGSADGQTWSTVDTQTGQQFSARFQTKEYHFTNPSAYQFYRLDITANAGGVDIIQLAEWQLSNGDTTVPPPSDMKSFIGKGPASSPTAKTSVGYGGLRAFQISGRHLADGRAYSYNKVFDVDLPITRTTELSYVIFPEFTNDDLRNPATYVAVDLAFSDGTYLSDLGAVDQHGAILSPPGQGASKTLYTMQWNAKRSTIGAVAAGKTVKRILVGYDNPSGPATVFRTWVDDIRIGDRATPARSGLADFVDTRRGSQSSGGFSRGNNFPATAVPHGFNFWTPMTNAGSSSWLYEYHRMNSATSNLPMLQAFAASHEPSPWMGDRQTFQVMPGAGGAGAPDGMRGSRALEFRHENEIAHPHYYSVTFENGLRTEIAPTDHAALFRFTFTGDTSNLVFDNLNNASGLSIDAANGVVTGYSDNRSGLSTGATRLFVYAKLDRPIVASGMLPQGNRVSTGYAQFDTSSDKVVTMRIATSLISLDQARHNLDLEIAASDTLESVRERAQALWDKQLKVVEVEGATEDQRITLYSNLYRLFLYPNSAFENTGSAASPAYKHAVQSSTMTPPSTPTQTGAPVVDGKVYVNNGFWDTYRTAWPAYTLFTPTMAGEMINGFVQQYRDGGWVSRWSSPGYANLMVGTSSDVAFADAYVKGVRNFDAAAAYDAAVKNATVAPPNDNIGRKGFASSPFLGYTAMDATDEAMSWAMDGYINDFGIANMAKARLDGMASNDPARQRLREEYEYFLNRAQNYVNMFDPSVGFFQGRDSAGNWRMKPADFDPRVWGGDYTETDAWNMAFHVPQDGRGLANLYGGTGKLADKLDQFFATPETATFVGSYGGTIHEMLEARDVRMGQYGHSNQPSHHIIYMYDYAGQPWKTQAKVREAVSRLYLGSEIGQGYTGDEDNGEMSAWYVFSALGFYPLQMGSPYYAIGSPLFTKATINLENGKKIVVNAPNNSRSNVYVQSLKVNGRAYDRTYLPHDILAKGAVLDFAMGSAPSRWGAGNTPLSITQDDGVPRPLRDVTKPDGTALFDNTSATRVNFDSQTPSVPYQITSGPRDKVSYYTLTSGPTLGVPRNIMGKGTEVSATAENPPNEVKEKLVDGDPSTKWLAFQPTATLTFKLPQPVAAVHYTLTSANDAPERDPRDWTLQGSTDGTTWTTLDTRTGQTFTDRGQNKDYGFTNSTAYQFYRLDITANGGAPLIQLAEVALSDGVTAGDPKSWTLKGSYDGKTWTVIDQRTDETFRWRLQTRAFKVSRPGRYTQYRLEVTANTGDATTTLAEMELLARPAPACTATVSGRHDGALVVSSGLTCLAPGATVTGPVAVRPGASLYAVDATIGGPLAAAGAASVVLVHTSVAGPIAVTGTTGEVSIEDSDAAGPVVLVANAGQPDAPALVSFDRIRGPLSCVANNPPPVDNGLSNTVGGTKDGQCQGL